ncbi:hypothetical protein PWG15_03000 [Ensifer adhaerens]|uniref:hypothetical protein n=1 Tax=Ensifer adhaerens TaxID=106592 RepID=UPI0023AA04FA|nr:hypothetical protein [Ensifer adhaerens]WDZ77494.1 hypothetical protein PWG15_03000 [Ensifer adhaerens]
MKTEHQGEDARQKGFRGRMVSIETFARKYRLDAEEAARLENQFGPVAGEIDLLQAARRNGMPEE